MSHNSTASRTPLAEDAGANPVPVMCTCVSLLVQYGTIVPRRVPSQNNRRRCSSPTSFCCCTDVACSDYSAVDARRSRVFGGGTACLERSPSRNPRFDINNHLPPRTKDGFIPFIVWPIQMKNFNRCSISTLLQYRTLLFLCVQCPCNALAFKCHYNQYFCNNNNNNNDRIGALSR